MYKYDLFVISFLVYSYSIFIGLYLVHRKSSGGQMYGYSREEKLHEYFKLRLASKKDEVRQGNGHGSF